MSEQRVGFDLDGTLCELYWNTKFPRWEWWKLKQAHKNSLFWNHINFKLLNCKPKLLPKLHYFDIITSRSFLFEEVTMTWLNKVGIHPFKIIFAPKLLLNNERIKFKEKIIKERGVTIYFEDEIEIRIALRKLCKNTFIYPPNEATQRGIATENNVM
jgi:hypothetical protein